MTLPKQMKPLIECRREYMVILNNPIKKSLSVLLAIAFVALSNGAVFAMDTPTIKIYGVAIKGYDPVAYFTEHRAVKGKSDYFHDWNEASWYFSTPEHRDLFAANPQKYAPKHGGF